MVVAAAAAVVLGGGVGVGVGIAAAAAAAAAVEVVIESDFHIGILLWCDWARVWIGYGTGMDRGMDRDTLSGPAFSLWLWRKRAVYF